jgi:hypothetical protein
MSGGGGTPQEVLWEIYIVKIDSISLIQVVTPVVPRPENDRIALYPSPVNEDEKQSQNNNEYPNDHCH